MASTSLSKISPILCFGDFSRFGDVFFIGDEWFIVLCFPSREGIKGCVTERSVAKVEVLL